MAANTNGRSPLARALCGSLGLFGACSVSFRGTPSGKRRTAAFTAQVYRHLVYRRAVGEGRAGPEISDARANRGLRHCLRFSHSGKQRTAAFTVNFTAKVYRHLVYRRAEGEGRAGPEIIAARTNGGLRHCLRFSHSGNRRTAAFTVKFTAHVYRHLVYRQYRSISDKPIRFKPV